jgi:hypothetical protein
MWLYYCFSRISYVPLWHNHFQRLFRLNHCDPCLPPMLTERLWGRNSDFWIVFDFLYVWMYDVFRFLDFSFRSHWFLQHLHQLIKWTWTDHISWPWNSSADSLWNSGRLCRKLPELLGSQQGEQKWLKSVHDDLERRFPENGGTQNEWFMMENPSINGWFAGNTILGNLHVLVFL